MSRFLHGIEVTQHQHSLNGTVITGSTGIRDANAETTLQRASSASVLGPGARVAVVSVRYIGGYRILRSVYVV